MVKLKSSRLKSKLPIIDGLLLKTLNIDFKLPSLPKHPIFREQWLNRINNIFTEENDDNPYKLVIIYGLSGIGKSTLANLYAYRNKDNYNLVIWLKAKDGIKDTLFSLGRKLNINTIDQEKEEKEIVFSIYQKLSEIGKWLLIFDNLTSEDNNSGYLPTEIELESLNGNIIITTCSQRWSLTKPLSLSNYTIDEVKELIRKFLPSFRKNDIEDLAILIEDKVNNFPLAVTQIVRYVAKENLSLDDCKQIFLESDIELLAEGHDCSEYPYTVITIIQRIIKAIEMRSVIANTVIRYCCYLAPSDIPVCVLQTACAYDEKRLVFQKKVLSILYDYSLIEMTDEKNKKYVSMHALTQKIIFNLWITDKDSENDIIIILKAFIKNFPVDYHDFFDKQYCYPELIINHLKKLIKKFDTLSIDNEIKEKIFLLLTVITPDYENKIFFLKKIIALNKEIKSNENIEKIALTHRIIALIYYDISLIELSDKYAKKSLSLLKQLIRYKDNHPYSIEMLDIIEEFEKLRETAINELKPRRLACLTGHEVEDMDSFQLFEKFSGTVHRQSFSYDERDLDETIAYYERNIRTLPNRFEFYKLSCLYHLNNQIDLAKRCFKKGYKIFKILEFVYGLGFLLYKLEKHEETIEKFQQIIDAKLEFQLSFELVFLPFLNEFGLSDYDFYDKKITIDCLSIVYYLIIKCLLKTKQNDKIKSYFDSLCQIVRKNKSFEGYRLLGAIYKENNEKEPAIINFIYAEINFIKKIILNFDHNIPRGTISSLNNSNVYSLFCHIINLACYYDCLNHKLTEEYFLFSLEVLRFSTNDTVTISQMYQTANTEYGIFLYKRSRYKESIEVFKQVLSYPYNKIANCYFDFLEAERLNDFIQLEIKTNYKISINCYSLAYYMLILSYIANEELVSAGEYLEHFKKFLMDNEINDHLYKKFFSNLEMSLQFTPNRQGNTILLDEANLDCKELKSLATVKEEIFNSDNTVVITELSSDTTEKRDSQLSPPITIGASNPYIFQANPKNPGKSIEIPGKEIPISPDGNCFFHAVAYEMERHQLGLYDHTTLRRIAVEHLRQNPSLFFQDGVPYEDDFDRYLRKMATEGEYVEGPLIQALAFAMNLHFIICHPSKATGRFDIQHENEQSNNGTICLILQGEHYTVLIPNEYPQARFTNLSC